MRDLEFQAADWPEISLGDVCSFRGGNGFREAYQGKRSGEHPFIKVSDLTNNGNEKYIITAQNWVSTTDLREMRATLQPPGAVVFAKVGAALKLNRRRILTRPTAIDNNMMAAIPNTNKLDSDFLYYFLLAQDLARFSQESAVPSVNQGHLASIVIALPSLPEQRKIAEILRTWDAALEALTTLRKAKARWLRGLARTLLNRAADDPATITEPLGSLSRIVKGQQLNKLDISGGEYPVWNGGITPSGFHNEWNTEGGTITISEGGNSCGFVNLSETNFWLGGHCYALQDLSNGIDRDFMFHALKSREREIMRLRVGSGLPNIQRADLEHLPVLVPPLEMQEKIARALSEGNAELTLIDAEIEALTRQKRGLMQKLLTGEWRVLPDSTGDESPGKEAHHAE